jgi:uncharacterized damage-inducible protein DinB
VHPHLTVVLGYLDEARRAVGAAVAKVPEGQRHTRPAPGRWSVAEVLEHLTLVDRSFAQRMADAIAEARVAGLGPENRPRDPLPPAVARRMADRSEAREAREALRPAGGLDAAAAAAELDAARDAVRQAVSLADGLALGSVNAEHRIFGSLTMYQWVELTAAHEMRHADQIREIADALARR